MNGHGRHITITFKSRKKAEKIPAKFDIEKLSQHKSTVKYSDKRI